MLKKYKNIGAFPLEFTNGQQVETGEEFSRDFEALTTASYDGLAHEQWLVTLDHISLVEDLPVSRPSRIVKPVDSSKKEE